jgi:hypothetical protein
MLESPSPELRAWAGFHGNDAGFHANDEFMELSAVEFLSIDRLATLVHADEMEPILAEVNADDVDVLVVHNRLRRNLQYPLREGGADHSIKRRRISRRSRDEVRLD